jgi:glutathione S-transferase
MSDRAPYLLYYWPSIPGRGEFVRLVLEQAGAPYQDVARQGGTKVIVEQLRKAGPGLRPLAPPILVDGEVRLAQTANICAYLGARHGLAPDDEIGRYEALQLQLTIADLASETHDTHHPVSVGLYYEDQKPEALRRARTFVDERMGKYLRYFEAVLQDNGGQHLVSDALSYVDLSMDQLLRGLEYAFPRALARLANDIPGLLALRERVDALPRIVAYRASDRCLEFSEDGLFRHYPELDFEP